MGKMIVDALKPDMCLSGDVIAPNGRLLLRTGSVLKEKHIEIFKAWGVTEADIEGVDEKEEISTSPQEIDSETLGKSQEYLEPLYIHANNDLEAMQVLHKLAVEYIAKEIVSGNNLPEFFLDKESIKKIKNTSAVQTSSSKSPLTLVQQEIQLVSLPNIFFKIMDALNSPWSSSVYIAEVVSKDSSLSAKLLRIVNSAFYGFYSKIDTISRAITMLGTNELLTLAQGISVIRVFKDIPSELIDMKEFWKHSIACGIFARLLCAQKIGLTEERFFVAGLMHDLGRLIMFKKLPRLCSEAMYLSRRERITLTEAEKKCFGFDHSKVGALLCKKWNLPSVLEEAINSHHARPGIDSTLESSIIHISDIMAHALCFGSSGNVYVPYMYDKAWKCLGLSTSVLSSIVNQADRQFTEMIQVFLRD